MRVSVARAGFRRYVAMIQTEALGCALTRACRPRRDRPAPSRGPEMKRLDGAEIRCDSHRLDVDDAAIERDDRGGEHRRAGHGVGSRSELETLLHLRAGAAANMSAIAVSLGRPSVLTQNTPFLDAHQRAALALALSRPARSAAHPETEAHRGRGENPSCGRPAVVTHARRRGGSSPRETVEARRRDRAPDRSRRMRPPSVVGAWSIQLMALRPCACRRSLPRLDPGGYGSPTRHAPPFNSKHDRRWCLPGADRNIAAM